MLIEGASEKERRELDKELRAQPGKPYSRGSGDLRAMMGGGGRRPPG